MTRLRGFASTARLLGIAVLTAALGLGIGLGLGALRADEPGSTKSTGRAIVLDVSVLSASLRAADSSSGKRRRRARLTVRLRARNTERQPLSLGDVALIVGRASVRPDPAARSRAADLLEALPPGRVATGTFRFETSGAVTDELEEQDAATLRLGQRTLPLSIDG